MIFFIDWMLHWGLELVGTASLACATGQCRNPLHLWCLIKRAFSTREGRRITRWFMPISLASAAASVFLLG